MKITTNPRKYISRCSHGKFPRHLLSEGKKKKNKKPTQQNHAVILKPHTSPGRPNTALGSRVRCAASHRPTRLGPGQGAFLARTLPLLRAFLFTLKAPQEKKKKCLQVVQLKIEKRLTMETPRQAAGPEDVCSQSLLPACGPLCCVTLGKALPLSGPEAGI